MKTVLHLLTPNAFFFLKSCPFFSFENVQNEDPPLRIHLYPTQNPFRSNLKNLKSVDFREPKKTHFNHEKISGKLSNTVTCPE